MIVRDNTRGLRGPVGPAACLVGVLAGCTDIGEYVGMSALAAEHVVT